MSTERDTHFQGFAKLLQQEIVEAYTKQVSTLEDILLYDDAKFSRELQLLIAQRAYDLVEHTLEHAMNEIEIIPEDIPDFDAWPEPPLANG